MLRSRFVLSIGILALIVIGAVSFDVSLVLADNCRVTSFNLPEAFYIDQASTISAIGECDGGVREGRIILAMGVFYWSESSSLTTTVTPQWEGTYHLCAEFAGHDDLSWQSPGRECHDVPVYDSVQAGSPLNSDDCPTLPRRLGNGDLGQTISNGSGPIELRSGPGNAEIIMGLTGNEFYVTGEPVCTTSNGGNTVRWLPIGVIAAYEGWAPEVINNHYLLGPSGSTVSSGNANSPVDCPSVPQRLQAGESGRTVTDGSGPTAVRPAPGDPNVLFNINEGDSFTVIGGASCLRSSSGNNLLWIEINVPGLGQGWAPEAINDHYNMEPVLPTPTEDPPVALPEIPADVLRIILEVDPTDAGSSAQLVTSRPGVVYDSLSNYENYQVVVDALGTMNLSLAVDVSEVVAISFESLESSSLPSSGDIICVAVGFLNMGEADENLVSRIAGPVDLICIAVDVVQGSAFGWAALVANHETTIDSWYWPAHEWVEHNVSIACVTANMMHLLVPGCNGWRPGYTQ